MNRKGNSRHNAYLSSLPLFLLPSPLWHPFFSAFSFLFFLFLLAETVWLLRFLSHGQMARSGVSPAPTPNKIESKILHLACTNIYFFLILFITDALFACQFLWAMETRLPLFDITFLSLSKRFALTCQNISPNLRPFEDKREMVHFCLLMSFKQR